MDYNKDGVITISDVKLMLDEALAILLAIFFLPGSLTINLIFSIFPSVPIFLELEAASQYSYGWVSGLISTITWLLVYAILRFTYYDSGYKEK